MHEYLFPKVGFYVNRFLGGQKPHIYRGSEYGTTVGKSLDALEKKKKSEKIFIIKNTIDRETALLKGNI